MKNKNSETYGRIAGLELFCHMCGCELPLMHPHIMLEHHDSKGNLICEECYQKLKNNKNLGFGSNVGHIS
ncbi:MAG: hypothetical protein U9N77_07545 [Thermodesulfobacteriota bacterium]|nr:hypothetical protein [Thermodesulfobacteriota bacterium]